ncbi:hypothetical protein G6L90_15690 [Agrobacterium tumefaciens]|uniref:hypothetical protein n=1 Tax=Agrobacterium tumefaciens TaxID=358 RepID=UPI0024DF8F02|nr:hypothetical protein [Agrobacterium tumefaciens]WHO23120.1 hypothetical protein G6L90_15690 [Agrobacterium tumefaciens]
MDFLIRKLHNPTIVRRSEGTCGLLQVRVCMAKKRCKALISAFIARRFFPEAAFTGLKSACTVTLPFNKSCTFGAVRAMRC